MQQTLSLKDHINHLRQRSNAAIKADDFESLLNEARALLKSAFQTADEEEARNLFRELRDRAEAAASATRLGIETTALSQHDQILRRVQHEQMRLNAGSFNDMKLAVSGLYDALCDLGEDADPLLRGDILKALEAAADKHAQLRREVKEMLASPDHSRYADVQALLSGSINHPRRCFNSLGTISMCPLWIILSATPMPAAFSMPEIITKPPTF